MVYEHGVLREDVSPPEDEAGAAEDVGPGSRVQDAEDERTLGDVALDDVDELRALDAISEAQLEWEEHFIGSQMQARWDGMGWDGSGSIRPAPPHRHSTDIGIRRPLGGQRPSADIGVSRPRMRERPRPKPAPPPPPQRPSADIGVSRPMMAAPPPPPKPPQRPSADIGVSRPKGAAPPPPPKPPPKAKRTLAPKPPQRPSADNGISRPMMAAPPPSPP